MIHPNVFLFLFFICWVVAASLMAEKTNVGTAVFIADITSMCSFGWSCCTPFYVLVCLLLQPSGVE